MDIVLVHGTWARDAPWTGEASRLRTALAEHCPQPVSFYVFAWSGRNSFRDREAAVSALQHVLRERADACHDPILIVAHSHGGNIAFEALRSDSNLSHRCRLVCLSTPFFVFSDSGVGARDLASSYYTILKVLALAGLASFMGFQGSAILDGTGRFFTTPESFWDAVTWMAIPFLQ